MSKEKQNEQNDFSALTLSNLMAGVVIEPEVEEVETTEDTEATETTEETEEVETTEAETTEETAETTETEEPEEDNSLKIFYQEVNKELGIEEFDESKLEEGIPGLMKYLGGVVEATLDEEVKEIKSLGNGLLGDLYDFLKSDGKVEDFKKVYFDTTDYSKISVEGEDNEANQKAAIEALLREQGEEEEDIKDKLETYESAGILEKEAKSAQKKLVKLNEVKKANLIKEQEAHQAEQKRKVEEFWSDVKKTIDTSNDIGGLPIAKDKKEAFFNYMTKVGKDGKTDYQRKLESDKQSALKMAYTAFLDFDYSTLQKKAKSEAVVDLKKTLNRFTDTVAKTGKGSTSTDIETGKKASFEGLRLENIIKSNKK